MGSKIDPTSEGKKYGFWIDFLTLLQATFIAKGRVKPEFNMGTERAENTFRPESSTCALFGMCLPFEWGQL